MSERPIEDLRPVQAQTPARTLGDDRQRRLERQRIWLLRRRIERAPYPEERRVGERRSGERRLGERRVAERRSQDRRQDERPGGDRRRHDRRQGDRRRGERRLADRRREDRGLRWRGGNEGAWEQAQAPHPRSDERYPGHIDDYA